MTPIWRIAAGCLVAAGFISAALAAPVEKTSPPTRVAPPAPPEPPAYPGLEALERELERMVATASPSVVGVVGRSELKWLLEPLGEWVQVEQETEGPDTLTRRIGTGVVLDGRGHIATLASVVSGAREILVLTSGGGRLHADLTGTDEITGLAVVRLNEAGGSLGELRPVVFGDSDAVRAGALVTTLNSRSSDRSPQYSVGIVSGVGATLGPGRSGSFLKLNAPSAPGAGGGPVLDTRGRLIGVVFGAGLSDRKDPLIAWDRSGPRPADRPEEEARISADVSLQILGALHRAGVAGGGISYAVPSNVVRRVTDQIIRSGSVRRGWVGIRIEEAEPGDVRLVLVVPDGPAQKAGLMAGDRIVGFNGEAIQAAGYLVDRLTSTPPGATVRLEVVRKERRIEIPVTLGESPAREVRQKVEHAPAPRHRLMGRPRILGVDVDTETADEIRLKLGSSEGVGLLVLQVHENSRAQRAGIRRGDLIVEVLGRPMLGLMDLRAALRDQPDAPMRVKVLREGRPLVLMVEPAQLAEDLLPPEPPRAAPAPAPKPPAARRNPPDRF